MEIIKGYSANLGPSGGPDFEPAGGETEFCCKTCEAETPHPTLHTLGQPQWPQTLCLVLLTSDRVTGH